MQPIIFQSKSKEDACTQYFYTVKLTIKQNVESNCMSTATTKLTIGNPRPNTSGRNSKKVVIHLC